MMNCRTFTERYLDTETASNLPILASLHLLVCPACREEVRRMEQALASLRRSAEAPQVRDMSREIMARITILEPDWESRVEPVQEIALANWIAVGLLIIAGFFFADMNQSFVWMKISFGKGLDIMISVVMGIVFTIYAAVFIASHMDFIANRIGLDRRKHSEG